MFSPIAGGQDAGCFLVSQLVDELMDVVGDVDRLKLEARLSAVLALYEIRPRKPAAGHPDIIEKAEMFISAIKVEGYSPYTISAYELELKTFAENVVRPAGEITTADIRLYLAEYEKLKPSSRAKKLSNAQKLLWLVNG